jgi:hypothetical protein
VNLSRVLKVLGCWCLFVSPAIADHTVQDFSGGATETPYSAYGNGVISGQIMSDGPAHAAHYYRLAYTGVFGTNNMIAFDRTQVGRCRMLS